MRIVTFVFKWLTLGLHCLPLQSLIDDEVENAPIFLHETMCKMPISSQLGRHAMEFVDAIDPCYHISESQSINHRLTVSY
jgi:hypothetical protein